MLAEFGVITSGCCPGESTASLQIPSAVVGRERRVVITARNQEGRVYNHGGENVTSKPDSGWIHKTAGCVWTMTMVRMSHPLCQNQVEDVL